MTPFLDYHTPMIQLKPIAIVHNGMGEGHHDTRWHEIESDIVVNEEWREALDGLEQFSHIWIIFYFDRITPPRPDSPRVHPMRRKGLPLVGRFATRTPQRPNPIGLSPVELLAVRGNTLRVRGLEALEGTPVLDIKPYIARGDVIENTRVGEWVKQYWVTQPPKPE